MKQRLRRLAVGAFSGGGSHQKSDVTGITAGDFETLVCNICPQYSHGALLVTEFGGGYSTDAQNLVPTLDGQDRYLVTGATVWVSLNFMLLFRRGQPVVVGASGDRCSLGNRIASAATLQAAMNRRGRSTIPRQAPLKEPLVRTAISGRSVRDFSLESTCGA